MKPILYEKQIESIRRMARAWTRARSLDLSEGQRMRLALGFVLMSIDKDGMADQACDWVARTDGKPSSAASTFVPGLVACSTDDGRMFMTFGGNGVSGAKVWARLLPAMVPEVAA